MAHRFREARHQLGARTMRVLTPGEGLEWLADAGHPRPEDTPSDWGYFHEAAYRVPPDAGRKTALARLLVALAEEEGQGLLWITGYSIWPSSENLALFYALRRSLGESRELRVAPCHLFGSSDVEAVECLLDLALYFSWDAVLYAPSGKVLVSLSHDEILELFAKDPSSFCQLEQDLKRFRLTPI